MKRSLQEITSSLEFSFLAERIVYCTIPEAAPHLVVWIALPNMNDTLIIWTSYRKIDVRKLPHQFNNFGMVERVYLQSMRKKIANLGNLLQRSQRTLPDDTQSKSYVYASSEGAEWPVLHRIEYTINHFWVRSQTRKMTFDRQTQMLLNDTCSYKCY